MILYLDTSALVKLYVRETGSAQVKQQVNQADLTGTIDLTKVEMAAAFAKAARMKVLSPQNAQIAWQTFKTQWPSIYQLEVSGTLRERAIQLIWAYGLRSYDAMHLSAAHIWQGAIGDNITFGTFDLALWQAGKKSGLNVWPKNLETFFEHTEGDNL
ncbi:MAG: Ribonuclease VapC49 [Chloroflexi bacterium]|nr:Ribonuclease VapC49 [Chloroflexota bacterium]